MSTCADCCPPAKSPVLPEHARIESNLSGHEKQMMNDNQVVKLQKEEVLLTLPGGEESEPA